jgi:hypothetical protein
MPSVPARRYATRIEPMSEGNGARPQGHVLFLWSPDGYTLQEADGHPPAVGEAFEAAGHTLVVAKVGPSPLPGDTRRCAYTVGK